MDGQEINLNEEQNRQAQRTIMFRMHNKNICLTRCSNFPFEEIYTSHMTVTDMRASLEYRQLKLPRCLFWPQPETRTQGEEWGRFMTHLRDSNKVAIMTLKDCEFYLLPLDGRQHDKKPECTAAVALYRRKTPLECANDREEILDKNLENTRSIPRDHSRRHCEENVQVSGAERKDIHESYFVRTDPSYLKTLSQTHAAWPFGAIAELTDNSRDANATRLDISIEHLYSKNDGEKIPVLAVIDNGTGMSHEDIMRMLSFGHQRPGQEKPDRIGRFGIGFKTGAMKLGKDALVLTQTKGSRSVAFLSQSYNANKDNLEIPIIAYRKLAGFMEFDLSIHSAASANLQLDAIKEFSLFNEYLLGERWGRFGETGTGTQIYIWNLEKRGDKYCLESEDSESMVQGAVDKGHGDILIHSRKPRSRPGQLSQNVPLDYSLKAYLEVMFLEPRMKIYVQDSLVKTRPLAKSLHKTSVVTGTIMGKDIKLTLGRSRVEWERGNGGLFLYWHGRLIEAYKRVGCMMVNGEIGRGVLGVVDVSALIDDDKGEVWVLNNKQGFQDSEAYDELKGWLESKMNEYWDENFDRVGLEEGGETCEPDHEWVQCDKCRKWRILRAGFDTDSLPPEWFCYMEPFSGTCEDPEQQPARGVITIATKRSRGDNKQLLTYEEVPLPTRDTPPSRKPKRKRPDNRQSLQILDQACDDDDESGDESTGKRDPIFRPKLEKPGNGNGPRGAVRSSPRLRGRNRRA